MFSYKLIILIVVILPFTACLTVIEEIFLTKQLAIIFGDDFEESPKSGNADKNIVSLLSQLDEKERGNNYWSRRGHRRETTTESYDYPENFPQQTRFSFRKRRDADLIQKIGVHEKAPESFAAIVPNAIKNDHLKNNLKCCHDSEDYSNSNETLQIIKNQCLRDIRRMRKSSEDSSTNDHKSIFSCDKINSWKAIVTCTIDCVAQKLEMINSDGTIDINATQIILRENFTKEKWEQVFSDDLVEKCAEFVEQSNEDFNFDKFGLKCNTKMAQFSYCMWRELTVNCPENKQQKSKQCKRLRSVLNKTD